jgi:hypothetical protein
LHPLLPHAYTFAMDVLILAIGVGPTGSAGGGPPAARHSTRVRGAERPPLYRPNNIPNRNRQAQRRLLGEDVTIIKSAGTDYTVVVDNEDFSLAPTCQERVVIVKPVGAIRDVPRYLGHLSGNLETVGLAVPAADQRCRAMRSALMNGSLVAGRRISS